MGEPHYGRKNRPEKVQVVPLGGERFIDSPKRASTTLFNRCPSPRARVIIRRHNSTFNETQARHWSGRADPVLPTLRQDTAVASTCRSLHPLPGPMLPDSYRSRTPATGPCLPNGPLKRTPHTDSVFWRSAARPALWPTTSLLVLPPLRLLWKGLGVLSEAGSHGGSGGGKSSRS